MGITAKQMAVTVSALGLKAFILGILAENKKPASGTPTILIGRVVCKYPSDPSVILGFLSIASLATFTVVGYYSLFYPYKGKAVPRSALFRSTTFSVYFLITLLLSSLGEVMMMWATFSELIHLTRNVHSDMDNTCPTAKTGLFGGAAFLALNASLFWLLCLMLANNARHDYFDEEDQEDNRKGLYGQVLTTDYEANEETKV